MKELFNKAVLMSMRASLIYKNCRLQGKMAHFLKTPIGSIILGIVLTAASFLLKKQSVLTIPCVLGLLVMVMGVMRWTSDKIDPDGFFGTRKEGLGVLLFGLSLLIINAFYLSYYYQYMPLLLFFGTVSFFFSLALILFPSRLNEANVPKIKQRENILDSPFDEAKQTDIFQAEYFYSNVSLYLYWDNASKSAKIAWVLALLMGGAVYLSLLHYLK